MVYSCATSLVSFELIHIKHIEEKETPLSAAIEDMMHKLQVSMGESNTRINSCDVKLTAAHYLIDYSAQNLLLQNQRLDTHRR